MDSNHFKWFKMRWLDSIAVLFPRGLKSNFTSFDLHKGFLEGLMWFNNIIFQKKRYFFLLAHLQLIWGVHVCQSKTGDDVTRFPCSPSGPHLDWEWLDPSPPQGCKLGGSTADSKKPFMQAKQEPQEPQPMEKTPRADFGWLPWNTS